MNQSQKNNLYDIITYGQHILTLKRPLFKKVIEIFEKNNIPYFADRGTLLGIVRHNSEIPWNDDYSVYMPEHDFVQLTKRLSHIISKVTDEDNNLIHQYISIADKDHNTFFMKISSNVGDINLDFMFYNTPGSICKIFCFYRKVYYYDMKMHMSDYICIDVLDIFHSGDIFPKPDIEGIYPIIRMGMNDMFINVMNNYDSYLKTEYGDKYMERIYEKKYENEIEMDMNEFKNNKIMKEYDKIPNYDILGNSDFIVSTYKNLNPKLQYLSDTEAMYHYIKFGKNDGLVYKLDLPKDFDVKYYKEINPDIAGLLDIECMIHYTIHGKRERRLYKLSIPIDFNVANYKKLNIDIENLSDIECMKHYQLHGRKEGRIYNLSLPHDFDVTNYKKLNIDIAKLSDIECMKHYQLFGKNEGRRYK